MDDPAAAGGGGNPAPPPEPEIVVRVAQDRDRADEWVLVLTAVGLTAATRRRLEDAGFAVLVPAGEVGAALSTLGTYDREAAESARRTPEAPTRGTGLLGVVVPVLLLGFSLFTGFMESPRLARWFIAGRADAAAIRAGQVWRGVTAMTLHGDLIHLVGNMVASLLFISTAARWLGPGVAAILIVAAGTAANLLTALIEEPTHRSLGASTATFAALGIVAGLQVVRRWRGSAAMRRRAWLAAGAGLAVFAMLGVGEHADVWAHLTGLGVGLVAGVAAGITDRGTAATSAPTPAPSKTGRAMAFQIALGVLALGGVVGAWALALRASP